jgi:transcriptional regulator with XRE-family HTH domain
VATVQDFNSAVCDALIDFMVDHGVSQVQVATRLDRSQSYVSGRLNGKLDLSLDIIGAVAELAHISPKALWIEVIERTGQASSER